MYIHIYRIYIHMYPDTEDMYISEFDENNNQFALSFKAKLSK